MSSESILIAEDDPNIASLIRYNLEKENFKVFTAHNGQDALSYLHDETIDLAVLDIMLPEVSGLDICRQMRSDDRLKNIPVIFVTARINESDVVIGFNSGADDYLTKPFSPKELIVRIRALFKRSRGDSDYFKHEGMEIFFNKHMVKYG